MSRGHVWIILGHNLRISGGLIVIMWQASAPNSVLWRMKHVYMEEVQGEEDGKEVTAMSSNKVWSSQDGLKYDHKHELAQV